MNISKIPNFTGQMQAPAFKPVTMPTAKRDAILDKALDSPLSAPKVKRPRAVQRVTRSQRIDEMRGIGAFDFVRTDGTGHDLYDYCKDGVAFYRLLACGTVPVSCTCTDACKRQTDPAYTCKHMSYFTEMTTGVPYLHAAAMKAILAKWEDTEWACPVPEFYADGDCVACDCPRLKTVCYGSFGGSYRGVRVPRFCENCGVTV